MKRPVTIRLLALLRSIDIITGYSNWILMAYRYRYKWVSTVAHIQLDLVTIKTTACRRKVACYTYNTPLPSVNLERAAAHEVLAARKMRLKNSIYCTWLILRCTN